MDTKDEIFKHKIVSIIRGADPADVIQIAEALYEGGIRLLEITLNSKNALRLIGELNKKMENRMLIGAGTVLNTIDAANAIDAGAKFIISPIIDLETIRYSNQNRVVSIPGAFTPTEINYAYNNGADIIKVFPAAANPNYIKEIRAPLPHIPLMPTGGINLENIGSFLKTGAVAFGIGTALVDTKKEVNDEYLNEIRMKAKQFVEAINNPS
jgi:2-dehydro-3-deoxyphosphogluconate aldolase / (4S)-4-hydroxy-2-oxoglutarate aldolase